MRTLALDLGNKKIGLAISDPLGITAQPLGVLIRKGKADVLRHIKDIIRDKDVSDIVVGLPLNMDGTPGERAKEACEFVDEIKGEVGVPVRLWDERLTTSEVNRILLRADVSRSKRKKVDDKLAAQLILQSYLDAGGRKS